MSEKKIVESLVTGGKATAGPPLGPALGPLGINVLAVVNKINELTNSFAGMKVPVKVVVDVETKQFEVTVGVPSTAALLVRAVAAEKGSGTPKTAKIGNITMDQIKQIAQMKKMESYATTVRAAAREAIGTCVSIGITVEGKDPKDILREMDKGEYASYFKEEGS